MLEQNHFSLTRTAEQLKISRHALRYRMQRLNISTGTDTEEDAPAHEEKGLAYERNSVFPGRAEHDRCWPLADERSCHARVSDCIRRDRPAHAAAGALGCARQDQTPPPPQWLPGAAAFLHARRGPGVKATAQAPTGETPPPADIAPQPDSR